MPSRLHRCAALGPLTLLSYTAAPLSCTDTARGYRGQWHPCQHLHHGDRAGGGVDAAGAPPCALPLGGPHHDGARRGCRPLGRPLAKRRSCVLGSRRTVLTVVVITLHSVVCVYFLFSRDALPRWYFAGTGETVLPPFSPRGSDRDAASPRVEKQPLVLWCGHGGRSHRSAIAQRASFHPVRPILSASVSVDPPPSNSTHFNLLNEIHSM